ncbi:DUF1772-domain-containing protein [Xylaria digitata]|nr:DUF1772-domain-containing protein [Xylaria digitata]
MSSTTVHAAAVVSGSFLSGAMLGLSLVTVPVILDTTDHAPHLFRQWARLYHYGHQIMPSIAVGTLALYAYAAVKRSNQKRPWGMLALAGVTTICIVPFTWIVMTSGNNNLFRLEAASRTTPTVMGIDEAKGLVTTWAWLHSVRTLFPLLGAVVGAIDLLRK